MNIRKARGSIPLGSTNFLIMSKITTDQQNEVFDVVNENDEVVGEATRGEVHQNPKLIHRVVHIWILKGK